jgi:tetratricopeptide (TPR) repeat protein
MSSSQSDRYEETIRPIARPRQESDVSATATQPDYPKSHLGRNLAIGAVLLLGVIAVFFVLPNGGDTLQSAATEQAPVTEAPAPEPANVLSAEDRRRLDAESQRDLAALLTQQDRLRARGAEDWGAEDWQRYLDLAVAGDDAYLAEDVVTSSASYAEALELGTDLLGRSDELFGQLVTEGFAAIDAADWMTARARFAAALEIRPDDVRAQAGGARARTLPDVLELMRDADEADDAGDLPGAIALYREALSLDAEWTPAREALNGASARLAQYEFDQQLDRAYGALAESRFDDALTAFDRALEMRPNSQAAADGRFQAEEGLRLGQIRLAQVRALAFERRELWSDAIAQYEAALDTDPTLEYAIEGLERSRVRRDLELKVMNLLDNPRLLFDDSVLAEARVLRQQAADVQPRGTQIDDQLARLDALIDAATREYPVALVSDGLTNITVFRLGTLGPLVSTEVRLRPGNYTAVGSRNGFRDVRKSFTVLPGRDAGPIEIICTEPI